MFGWLVVLSLAYIINAYEIVQKKEIKKKHEEMEKRARRPVRLGRGLLTCNCDNRREDGMGSDVALPPPGKK